MALKLLSLLILLCGATAFANIEDEVPVVVREPASLEEAKAIKWEATGRIDNLIDNKTLRAISHFSDWYIGEVIAVQSQTPGVGIVGFVEVTGIEVKSDGTYVVTCDLLRQSRLNFIQIGDQIMHLDLSSTNEKYKGTTDLLIKEQGKNISSKYKPLYTLGVAAGETAETLWESEYLVTWYGQVNYGVRKWLTVSSVVPADLLGAPNASVKFQLYESYSNVFAAGLNFTKIPNETNSTLNLNIHWDSFSSESVVSHTFLSIALFSFEEAEDTTAIKSLGTSSLQTGNEFILDNWDRILVGPSYNFEKKAIGGFLTYLKIYDKFHLSFSMNSTNITSLKLSPVDGYYFLFDAYWRF